MPRSVALLAILAACSQDSGLKVNNSLPTATISAPSKDQVFVDGETVHMVGTVGDPDDATVELFASWWADGEVLCEAAAPTADGATVCDASFTPGTVNIVLQVRDQATAAAEDSVQIQIIPGDTPTVDITGPDGSERYYAERPIAVTALVSDTEDPADALSLSWASDLDGALTLPSAANSDGTVSGTVVLTEGRHELSLAATDTTDRTGTDRTSVTVGPANTIPDCEVTAPASPAVAEQGDTVTFEGLATDVDQPAGELAITWNSDKDGDLGVSTANSDGTVSYSTAGLSVDTHTITLRVRDEVGESCTDSMVISIGNRPEVSIDAPTSGAVVNQGAIVTFAGTVSDAEDPAIDLEIAWASDVDAGLSTAAPDSSGLTTFNTSALSPGPHIVTLSATDTDTLVGRDTVAFTINGLPSAPVVDLRPDPAVTADALTVSITTDAVDPEGTTVSYTYQWSKDGAVQSALTSATVAATHTARGELWSVRVLPSDGLGTGPAGTDSLTIGNTAPTVASVALSPTPATTDDTLSATASGADADGDSVSFTYAWTVNGVSTGTSGSTLDGSYFDKGDTVTVTATPSDGTDTGTSDTASLIIANTAPELSSVSISPDPASTSDTLSASASSSDADGDSVTYTYAWAVNGVSTGTSASTLANSYFSKGDTVTVTVTPTDGTDAGTSDSDSLVIGNTAPSVSAITMTPSPIGTNDTCSPVVTSADVDGDSVSYTYAWAVNGTAVAATSSTLSGVSYFDKGDTVTVTITPTDGTDAGAPVSASIVVGNTAPTVASVTLSPSTIYTNDTVNALTGLTSDPDGDAVTLTYNWFVNGISTGATSTSLSGVSYFDKGDIVRVVITPTDGTDTGSTVAANVTVSNSAPTAPVIALDPTSPQEGIDDLLCEITTASTDADGDPISYTFEWDVDGTNYPDGDTGAGWLGPVTDTYTDDMVPADDLFENEVWTCTVTPDDGTTSGTPDDASTTVDSGSTCGNSVLDSSEEYDPAPGPFSQVSVDYGTCRWDFSDVEQLYCNGSCTWSGGSGCDQTEADILCKLKTDNPASVATAWTHTTALAQEGFPCMPLGYGTTVNVNGRGVSTRVTWQDASILGNHGPGWVVAYPTCTNP